MFEECGEQGPDVLGPSGEECETMSSATAAVAQSSPFSSSLTLNLLLLPSLPTRPTPHCLSTAPASLPLPAHCSPLSRHLLACPQLPPCTRPPPLTRAVT